MRSFPFQNHILSFFLFLIIFPNCLTAQKDSTREKMYNMHPGWQLPVAGVCIAASSWGFGNLDRVAAMNSADILKLNPNDINAFDRPAAFLDPAGFDHAQKNSDLFLNICLFSPALLALDKKASKDWLDLITLYLAAHTVDNAIYFAFTYPIRRPRPLTYNTKLSVQDRTGEGRSNSFFSGHTSFSATATFFVAKVYTDYHQIKGWKRLLIYTGAAIPPALVGYYRMEAGKHFKSDVMVGLLSGAASGILVPSLFKNKKKNDKVSFAPYYTPGATGLTVMVGL